MCQVYFEPPCIVNQLQVDIEMSFIKKENIYALIEELLQYAWPDHLPPIQLPFPRMSYKQAIDQVRFLPY